MRGRAARRRALAAAFAVALAAAHAASAGTLRVQVVDQGGKPVADAVVQALPRAGPTPSGPLPAELVIDQVDKEFVPHVAAVRVGTPIRFPNRDQIRHHVYSFSPARSFEIPLYKGVPAEPIVFDRAGVVALGCNIHDWMSAFVVVADTPWFAVTGADGAAALAGLPAGAYDLTLWHEGLADGAEPRRELSLAAGDAELRFEIDRKRVFAPRRGGDRRGRYR